MLEILSNRLCFRETIEDQNNRHRQNSSAKEQLVTVVPLEAYPEDAAAAAEEYPEPEEVPVEAYPEDVVAEEVPALEKHATKLHLTPHLLENLYLYED
ncbi:uncharacterized protein N7473_003844 [Penicillium subrubescens]|uniref:uncharacterized protein n=1 Tax=Penicillium subrubescens TaxID=1316194 RepID=UPI0025455CDA|nr:uncharacterized protein N7473_003844 [Penicillium subrubescens]KAJ5906928.1 hypothetical protein N7473_003844 [Penicillium subrubescens]